MLNRRQFHIKELKERFDKATLDTSWQTLALTRPGFFKAVWSANQSARCRALCEKHGWSLDEAHYRLRDGLIVFHWAMGNILTDEFMAVGQNHMLVALMDIRQHLLALEEDREYIDLQPVLLLVALRGIAEAQRFEGREEFILRLMREVALPKDLLAVTTEVAIKLGLFHESVQYG